MVYGIKFFSGSTRIYLTTMCHARADQLPAGSGRGGSLQGVAKRCLYRAAAAVPRIYLYRSSRAAILSSSRRHRTSVVRVRPGAFLLDAARPTDDDTSAATATAAHSIFYIHIWTRERRSVRRGFSLPRDTPRYSHLKYKSLSHAPLALVICHYATRAHA